MWEFSRLMSGQFTPNLVNAWFAVVKNLSEVDCESGLRFGILIILLVKQ